MQQLGVDSPLAKNTPANRWFQLLVQNQTFWTAPLVTVLFALFVRWAVALNPYSGKIPFMWNAFEHSNHFGYVIPDANVSKAFKSPPCLATMKLKDIGWNSPSTCPLKSGTGMIFSGGVWITLLSQHTIVGFVASCKFWEEGLAYKKRWARWMTEINFPSSPVVPGSTLRGLHWMSREDMKVLTASTSCEQLLYFGKALFSYQLCSFSLKFAMASRVI